MACIPELHRNRKALLSLEGSVHKTDDGGEIVCFPPQAYVGRRNIDRINYGVVREPQIVTPDQVMKPLVADLLPDVEENPVVLEVTTGSHREYMMPQRIGRSEAAAD